MQHSHQPTSTHISTGLGFGLDSYRQFDFHPVTEKDIERIVKSLPSNKAPGHDKITARVLEDSLPVTISVITNLINRSFSSNTFAEVWKSAEVIPILKSGDFEEPSNTRPISLLPIMSKVIERAAHLQFVNYLDSHSTETALLFFTDEILKNMDAKKISLIVLLDMSKAFDSIRHDLLLAKLRNVGVSDSARAWFGSYLSHRSQVVRIEDSLSRPFPLTVGVPQGSILGPVLFTLYVNDLLSVPKHGQALGYVDDTKIFLAFPQNEINDAVAALNQDLTEISRWCCVNSLLINPEKTKLLVAGVPQLIRNLSPLLPPVKLLGRSIEPTPVARDLGVMIDSHLNYNEHITKTTANCMSKLSRINRIKHLLDKKTLLLLIHAFVFSKLFYCSTVWRNTSKRNINKLQLVQNFACRIILGLKKFDHISEGLKALNWLRVEDKLFLKDVLMVHKCLHNQAPSYLSDKFVRRSSIHNRITRNSCDLNVPFSRLKTGQRSFAFRGAKLYNNLPYDIKNITDAKVFKRRMLNHLIETSK